MSESIRVMPMYNPVCLWDEGSTSRYPDCLRMAFRDGHTLTYRLEVQQPKPHLISGEQLAELVERNTYGGYKGKHEKSR